MAEFRLLFILSTIGCTFIRKVQSIKISKNVFLLDFFGQKCKLTISNMISAIFEPFWVGYVSLNSFQTGSDLTILGGFLSHNFG